MAKTKDKTQTSQSATPTDLATLQKLYGLDTADSYARTRGFPSFEVMKAAEAAREKGSTNSRLIKGSERSAKVSTLKDIASTAAIIPGGERYSKAAMAALAKEAGLNVPEEVDPKAAAFAKLKGQPLPTAQESETDETPSAPDEPDAGYFSAAPLVQAPAKTGNEPLPTDSVTPSFGVGGAPVTPNNPTGNKSNPWAEGGLFADNPTHNAALNIQAREKAMYPYGTYASGPTRTYAPGEPYPFMNEDKGFAPSKLVASPMPAASNPAPNDFVAPPVVNTLGGPAAPAGQAITPGQAVAQANAPLINLPALLRAINYKDLVSGGAGFSR